MRRAPARRGGARRPTRSARVAVPFAPAATRRRAPVDRRRRACRPRPRAARTGPRPRPDAWRLGCSRRSPRSNGKRGANVASIGSRPALPVTVTRGSTDSVYVAWLEPVSPRTSSTSACIARRSIVPRTEAWSPRKLRSGASCTRRSQPRPSLRRASSRMRPFASTGCRASSRYPNVTRSLGTSRRKIGSPVVTRPSGYTSFRRTEAEYSKRPWWTYASATGSRDGDRAGEREDGEQGKEHAATPSAPSNGSGSPAATLGRPRTRAREEPFRRAPAASRGARAAPMPAPPPSARSVASPTRSAACDGLCSQSVTRPT